MSVKNFYVFNANSDRGISYFIVLKKEGAWKDVGFNFKIIFPLNLLCEAYEITKRDFIKDYASADLGYFLRKQKLIEPAGIVWRFVSLMNFCHRYWATDRSAISHIFDQVANARKIFSNMLAPEGMMYVRTHYGVCAMKRRVSSQLKRIIVDNNSSQPPRKRSSVDSASNEDLDEDLDEVDEVDEVDEDQNKVDKLLSDDLKTAYIRVNQELWKQEWLEAQNAQLKQQIMQYTNNF